MNKPLAITGLGVVSAVGCGVSSCLSAIMHEHSGIVQHLSNISIPELNLPCGEVEMSDEEMMKVCGVDSQKVISRSSLMGIMAAKEAVNMSGARFADKQRWAFINGTTVGGMEKTEKYLDDLLVSDRWKDYVDVHECGACTEAIADHLGQFDFVTTLSTACSSAANAIILGAELINSGKIDVAVVGGTECLSVFHVKGFNTLMILDGKPCRPFDISRRGLNLGEGAGYIVLESKEHAEARKADILCLLSGWANTCDAFHQTATSDDGIGAVLSMRKALECSGLTPADIDYINAHGTGTPNNDLSEACAIDTVFEGCKPYVSSTKSMTGHTTSASGGIEAVISVLCILKSMIPATLNLTDPIDYRNFIPVNKLMNGVDVRNVLSNSFGFGGNDTTLIFSKKC